MMRLRNLARHFSPRAIATELTGMLGVLGMMVGTLHGEIRTSDDYAIDAEVFSSGVVGVASTDYELDATLDVSYAGFADGTGSVYSMEVGYVTGDSTTVDAIKRIDPSPTDAASVRWNVSLDAPVSGITVSSFISVASDGLLGASVTSVTDLGSGIDWQVTASTGTGVGDLSIALVDARGVAPCIERLPVPSEAYTIGRSSNLSLVTLDADPVLSLQTGLFIQRIRVTNNHAFANPGFRLLITGLPEDVLALDASGTIPGRVSSVNHAVQLAPGASAVLSLEFFRTNRDPGITPVYSLQLLQPGEGQPTIPIGTRFEIDRLVKLDDGSTLIEWPSIPGDHYLVEYSGDMKTWLATGGQPIWAAGNRRQWIDNGPPKVQSHPSEVKTRYYRVVKIAPAN